MVCPGKPGHAPAEVIVPFSFNTRQNLLSLARRLDYAPKHDRCRGPQRLASCEIYTHLFSSGIMSGLTSHLLAS